MEKERHENNVANLLPKKPPLPQTVSKLTDSVKQDVNEIMSLKIKQIDISDKETLNCVLALESKVFGEGFLNEEELLRQIALCQKDGFNNAIGLYKNEKMIGFGLCYMGGQWTRDDVEIDQAFQDLSKIGYIKTVIVDPDFQGKSEGRAILQSMLQIAKNASNTQVLLHAWDWSPNDSSRRFFQKHGATTVKTYHQKWYQDSLENGWQCSRCGNPCMCSSIEMDIDLEGK